MRNISHSPFLAVAIFAGCIGNAVAQNVLPEMNANTVLFEGQEITSADCKFALRMQEDGNLVLYGGTKRGPFQEAVWSSRTFGRSFAAMQEDGNFVVYDFRTLQPRFATNTFD